MSELKSMHDIVQECKSIFLPGRRLFSLIVLAYLGFLAAITVLMLLPALGWLPDNALSVMGHFGAFFGTGDTHDLIHELVFALIVGTAAVGLLTQLWRPKESFSGQLVALSAWFALMLTAALTDNWVPQPLFIIFGGLTLLATIFHPAGRGIFSWLRGARVNRTLLILTVVAAVPLFILASANIGLQTAGGYAAGFFGHTPPASHSGDSAAEQEPSQSRSLDDIDGMVTEDDAADHDQKHIALGHYRNMAAFSFIIILLGVLASFRPPVGGWRLAAWVAGLLPSALGLASLLLPDAESALGAVWSVAAVLWGLVFIATAELTRN